LALREIKSECTRIFLVVFICRLVIRKLHRSNEKNFPFTAHILWVE
jgi:hypothetical protein